jgi:DNA-binding NarL/FixJ family response regulator
MAKRGILGLTPRQEVYMRLACQGASNQQVAEQRFVSRSTVKTGLWRAYRTVGVHSLAEACARLHAEASTSRA